MTRQTQQTTQAPQPSQQPHATKQHPTAGSPSPHIEVIEYGNEKNRILIIDNAFAHCDQLRNAGLSKYFVGDDTNFYPGIRAPAPEDYKKQLNALLHQPIIDTFNLSSATELELGVSAYSLPAQPQETLRPIQCIPHIDAPDANQFAVVHYIATQSFGGTGFYRHIESGLESINPTNVKQYFAEVKQQAIQEGKKLIRYMNGSNTLFERIASIEFKFNRLVVYRGNCLHAGNLDARRDINANPEMGRLTLNSLIKAKG
ncbi:DUF6445 family protein [Saccharophagus degradans]|uniref:DUF6445 family protein n=1 Tax=Saccharophagus degradans TaxID=86304 RepID=UPI0024782CB8|nr:DUF6445 family protein [Saccharophagus degradans]WGP00134.1 DUF6445 family protein [Saccharophagus degradans]